MISSVVWKNVLTNPVDEIPYERNGTGWSVDGNRDYIRKFLVMVNDRDLSAAEICYAPGIPLPFAPYVSRKGELHDLSCFNVKTHAMQPDKKDWQRWIVTCEYSNNFDPVSSDRPDIEMRPDFAPPHIEWDFEVVRQSLPSDLEGKAFLNSAMMPFTPTPTFEQAFAVLVYTRNQMAFDRKYAASLSYSLNSDEFMGALPGQAQCLPPKAELIRKGKWNYWKVTYRIRFRDDIDNVQVPLPTNMISPGIASIAGALFQTISIPRTWQPQFLDQGMCELATMPFTIPVAGGTLLGAGLVGSGIGPKEPIPILKRGGLPISQPVCLDGHGKELKQIYDPITQKWKIVPVWLKFTTYRSMPFADILVNGPRIFP